VGVRAGRHGIYSAFMPGVAFGESLDCQVATFEDAMIFYGLYRIVGTTWIEAAIVSHERTEHDPVT